jgi:hypothetical protein
VCLRSRTGITGIMLTGAPSGEGGGKQDRTSELVREEPALERSRFCSLIVVLASASDKGADPVPRRILPAVLLPRREDHTDVSIRRPCACDGDAETERTSHASYSCLTFLQNASSSAFTSASAISAPSAFKQARWLSPAFFLRTARGLSPRHTGTKASGAQARGSGGSA